MHKRFGIIVAAALAGAIVFALLTANFFVRRNRDYLIGRAEQALGRKVSMEQIEMTFWPLGVRLEEFALAGDPAFGAEDLLRAKDFRLELRLLPLFIGQFRPKRIVLDSPRINIVRDAAGRYNFRRAPRNEKENSQRTQAIEHSLPRERDILLLLMALLDVSDGSLRYRDLRNGGDLVISHIDLKVSVAEQDQPIEIQLEAAVMSPKPNLQVKSWIGPLAGIDDYRDVPFDGEVNADALDLGKVNKALPQFSNALPKALRFDGVYNIKNLKFTGTLNRLSLKGAVTGTDASFRFE